MHDVRGHHEGTLIQRPNGVKYVVVSLPGGQRRSRRACPHIHPPADRRKWCPEARQTLRDLQALEPEQLAANRLTLGQYLREWLEDVRPRLAPATWRKHEQHIRVHLAPALGGRRLSELSVGDVRRYLAGQRGLEVQTLRHHRATLRRALSDALREGLVNRNVAALAEPPPLPHRERPILTAAQVRTLIEGTREDRLWALWVLLATTGLREAEALGLTWEDVDLGDGPLVGSAVRTRRDDHREAVRVVSPDAVGPAPRAAAVHVRHTLHRVPRVDPARSWELRPPKTPKSRRTVTLPAVTADALREHRRRQLEERMAAGVPTEDGLVFVRPDGRPYHGSKLTALLYPILDRLELPRVHVHDLRHSAATILYGAGVPIEAIADMLGHSTTRVTADLYRHRVPEMQADLADRMDRALA